MTVCNLGAKPGTESKIEEAACRIQRLKLTLLKGADSSKGRDKIRKQLSTQYDTVKEAIKTYCKSKGKER